MSRHCSGFLGCWHAPVPDFTSEAYWISVIVEQAQRAVRTWQNGHSPDADMLCLERHFARLEAARA